MPVLIQPATLATASYVLAHLRPADQLEAFCQLPEGTKNYELAHALLMSGDNFVAMLHDQPIAFFGTSPLNVCTSQVWAVGTKRFNKAVPAITRFIRDTLAPDLVERGVTSMEARAMETHLEAHRWIHLTGAVAHGPPFVYGRNGEKFILFRWTTAALSAHHMMKRSTR